MVEGDNGKEPIKSEEELRKEAFEARLERYKANPEAFIEVTDLIVAAIRLPFKDEHGLYPISYMTGAATRFEMSLVRTEIVRRIDRILDIMDARQAELNKKRIVTPGPRIRDIFRKH